MAFASTIFSDASDAGNFRKELEQALRLGQADEVERRLTTTLAGLDHPVSGLCAATTLATVRLTGWSELNDRIAQADAHGKRYSAIGLDLSVHGDAIPGPEGGHEPMVETNYYTDSAFSFSSASRDALMAGYGADSTKWQGLFDDLDGTVQTIGLGLLNEAIERLRQPEGDPGEVSAEDQDARLLGACFLALRFFQAVRRDAQSPGLMRPMPILVGSNEFFPFFDSPVMVEKSAAPPAALLAVKGATNRPLADPIGLSSATANQSGDEPEEEEDGNEFKDGEADIERAVREDGQVEEGETVTSEFEPDESLLEASRADDEPVESPVEPPPIEVEPPVSAAMIEAESMPAAMIAAEPTPEPPPVAQPANPTAPPFSTTELRRRLAGQENGPKPAPDGDASRKRGFFNWLFGRR